MKVNRIMQWGFTLIELLVVMAVIGILATGIIVAINPVRNINQGKDATVKFDMAQIVRGLKAYNAILSGLYPEVGTPPLQNLVESGELDKLPKTPDGLDYNYQRSAICDSSGCDVVVWAKLYNAPSGTEWCWDSTNNKYKESPTAPAPGDVICP